MRHVRDIVTQQSETKKRNENSCCNLSGGQRLSETVSPPRLSFFSHAISYSLRVPSRKCHIPEQTLVAVASELTPDNEQKAAGDGLAWGLLHSHLGRRRTSSVSFILLLMILLIGCLTKYKTLS